MPRKEILTLAELLYLVPEEQNVRVIFYGLEVSGTRPSVSTFVSKDVNNGRVVGVEAAGDELKVWIEGEFDDDVPLISQEGYK